MPGYITRIISMSDIQPAGSASTSTYLMDAGLPPSDIDAGLEPAPSPAWADDRVATDAPPKTLPPLTALLMHGTAGSKPTTPGTPPPIEAPRVTPPQLRPPGPVGLAVGALAVAGLAYGLYKTRGSQPADGQTPAPTVVNGQSESDDNALRESGQLASAVGTQDEPNRSQGFLFGPGHVDDVQLDPDTAVASGPKPPKDPPDGDTQAAGADATNATEESGDDEAPGGVDDAAQPPHRFYPAGKEPPLKDPLAGHVEGRYLRPGEHPMKTFGPDPLDLLYKDAIDYYGDEATARAFVDFAVANHSMPGSTARENIERAREAASRVLAQPEQAREKHYDLVASVEGIGDGVNEPPGDPMDWLYSHAVAWTGNERTAAKLLQHFKNMPADEARAQARPLVREDPVAQARRESLFEDLGESLGIKQSAGDGPAVLERARLSAVYAGTIEPSEEDAEDDAVEHLLSWQDSLVAPLRVRGDPTSDPSSLVSQLIHDVDSTHDYRPGQGADMSVPLDERIKQADTELQALRDVHERLEDGEFDDDGAHLRSVVVKAGIQLLEQHIRKWSNGDGSD